MHSSVALVALLAFLAVDAKVAFNGAIDRMVVFGDSFSDDGVDVTRDLHGFKKYSDGPVWSEYLAKSLRLNPFNRIINYAYSGGKSGLGNYYFDDWSGVLWQVQEFLKIQNDIVDPHTLIGLQAGGVNDLFDFDSSKLQDIPTNALHSLHKLADAGAKHILFLNLPPAHQMPYFKNNQTLRSGMQTLITASNQILVDSVITPFKAHYPHVRLYTVDLEAHWTEIEDRLQHFSEIFTHHRTDTLPGEITQYGWFDEFHPSTVVHKLLANKAFDVIMGRQ